MRPFPHGVCPLLCVIRYIKDDVTQTWRIRIWPEKPSFWENRDAAPGPAEVGEIAVRSYFLSTIQNPVSSLMM